MIKDVNVKSDKEKIKKLPQQVFYSSREETNCPLITDMLKISRKINEKESLKDKKDVIISFTYGKRMIINGLVGDYPNIKRTELLEIVDYDPIKNNLLVMGSTEPLIETSIHFMIHHARKEIKVVAQINKEDILKIIKNEIPILEKKFPINSFEFIKQILKELKDNKIIGIKNDVVLFVGKDVKEIEEMIDKTL
jgi:hypothetical protein